MAKSASVREIESGLLLKTVRNHSIEAACRAIAAHYSRERGLWTYTAFDWINQTLFAGELPYPLIVIGLAAHGGCLGWSMSRDDRPPTILLHPSIWGGTEKDDPWRIPPNLLGTRYALDVLIHESIHVSVHYRLGGKAGGESSHNNPNWIAEVNRIAPLIGLDGVVAAMSKMKRVGKKVKRHCEGNITFDQASRFPHAVRLAWGRADYYRDRSSLPFEKM